MSEGEGDRNKEESHDSNNELHCLDEMLANPEKTIFPLLYTTRVLIPNEKGEGNDVSDKESNKDKNKTLIKLLNISKLLFADIESLGKKYHELHEKTKISLLPDKYECKTDPTMKTTALMPNIVLSGLLNLHVPPELEPTDTDLPETIFGQVDLQTAALAKLVKKSTKRLIKTDSNNKNGGDICVLDIGVVDSDGGDDYSDEHDAGDDESDDQNMDDDNDDEAIGDEEEQRIRLRMERSMKDMGEEDIESSNDEDGNTKDDLDEKQVKQKSIEELFDPVAEDLKDGFFDLNEMEEFADEEEDYLPSEAFGRSVDEESKHKMQIINKKSFHQRQREGFDENSDGENNDETDLEIYEKVKDVTRKKYRDQEDIDALYDMYQKTNAEDSDEDDVINMTAVDYFGEPKKICIERYKKRHPLSKKSADVVPDDNDNDSWGEYDFGIESREGWQDDGHDSGDEDDEMEDMKEPSTGYMQKENSNIDKGKIDDNRKLTKQDETLRLQTYELERELINEKPWQMRGESKSTSRPVNSLLEGTPEFEMANKQAPIITVEHTVDLEEAIKKRILAEDWDDVVPRELPDIGWNKKRGEAPEVSQEKSKLGLGELYEREYLKKRLGFDKDAVEKQTEEDQAKDEMKQLFANLCSKLDALSNYHFAPRPIADEAEARPITVPAIAMEEVLPLHVSDARGIAPEEVFATKRGREGILRSGTEMDQNDRKRQRQSKKATRRKARKEKEADEKLISRLQPGLGLNNPYEKRKVREELSLARARGKVKAGEKETDTKFGSSRTFFKRLQAEAQQTVHDRTNENLDNDREKRPKPRSSAFKL